MDKYSVVTPPTKSSAQQDKPKCPVCGSEAEQIGQVLKCPKCGTKPFEGQK